MVQFRVFFLPFLVHVSNSHTQKQWQALLHSTITTSQNTCCIDESYKTNKRELELSVKAAYTWRNGPEYEQTKNKTNGLWIKIIVWVQNVFSYTVLCFRFDRRNSVGDISENTSFGESFFFFSFPLRNLFLLSSKQNLV